MFTVRGEEGLRQVARRLRLAGDGGKILRKRMRVAIVAAAKPIRDEARQNALAIPSKGTGHTGLRSAIARATKTRVRMSGRSAMVAVETDPRSMPAGKRNLPSYMEGLGRWRHPTFGKAPWKDQPAHPYFFRAAEHHILDARIKVEAAVKMTAREIEGR